VLDGLTPEELAAAQVFIPAPKRTISEQTRFDADCGPHHTGG